MSSKSYGGRSIYGALTAAAVLAAVTATYAAAATANVAVDGAAVYQRRCSVCHGEKGNGRSHAAGSLAVAPRDFTSEDARRRLTREYMIAIVREGRPDTPMIARKTQLTQDEIEAAVDYVRATFLQNRPR